MKGTVGVRLPIHQGRKAHVDGKWVSLLSTVMIMELEGKYQSHLRASGLKNMF